MIESKTIFGGTLMRKFIETELESLKQDDNEIYEIVMNEILRQERSISLIASENFVFDDISACNGSILTNKYSEGYPNRRYYGGCKNVDAIEHLAIDRLKKLFGAECANVQPHSGTQANMAVYFAVLSPGDTVLGMDLNSGGHLTHGSKVNISGKYFNFIPYGVDKKTGFIDYDSVKKLAQKYNPKMIVCGASSYPRIIDFKKFRKIADEVNAYLMADISHISGLIVAGLHPSPVEFADFITSTTHKTLRGPRGGVIMCKKEYETKINKAVFPGTQGGPHQHTIAAKAMCFKNALSQEFKEYMHNVVKNCSSMANEFISLGMHLFSGGTDNHLLVLDLSNMGITGKDLQERLDNVNITTNKETIPDDKLGPQITSGLRIGTPAITSRGMNENDCKTIANLIYLSCTDFDHKKSYITNKVAELTSRYPIYM